MYKWLIDREKEYPYPGAKVRKVGNSKSIHFTESVTNNTAR